MSIGGYTVLKSNLGFRETKTDRELCVHVLFSVINCLKAYWDNLWTMGIGEVWR